MESKIPEWFLSFYENVFSAQLRAVRQLKSPKPKRTKGVKEKGMSNMDMATDILRRASSPSTSPRLLLRSKPDMGLIWTGNPWSAPWLKRSIDVRDSSGRLPILSRLRPNEGEKAPGCKEQGAD